MSRIFQSQVDKKFYHLEGDDKDFQKVGSLVSVTDIADIKSSTILSEVLGLARPQYTLTNACRIIPSDSLEFSIDVATKLSASEKVPELVEADLKKNTYSRTAFDLWKTWFTLQSVTKQVNKHRIQFCNLALKTQLVHLLKLRTAKLKLSLKQVPVQVAAETGRAHLTPMKTLTLQ